MRRFADETTVHGIREAYYANRGGRLFWVLVFLGCCTAMVFQLRGLFESYVSERVGTRVTHITSDGYIEVPAFHFCNTMWMPNVEPFVKLLNKSKTQHNCDDCGLVLPMFHGCGQYARIWNTEYPDYVDPEYQDPDNPIRNSTNMFDLPLHDFENYIVPDALNYNHEYDYDDYDDDEYDDEYGEGTNQQGIVCKLQEQFWRATMIERIVNGFLIPVDPEVTQVVNGHTTKTSQFYPFHSDHRNIFSELELLVRDKFNGSLRRYVENQTVVDGGIGLVNGHGILDLVNRFPEQPISKYELDDNKDPILKPYFEKSNKYMDALLQRPAVPSLNFNGVCWKVDPGPIVERTETPIGKKYKYVVLHTGGAGYRLREFREHSDDLAVTLQYASQTQKPFYAEWQIFENADQKYDYATFVSVSSQNESQLSFNQRVRLDSKYPVVVIRAWTQKVSYVNRKLSPCRNWWTELDQAHCNQRLNQEKGAPCEHYLPQSLHYAETKLSNKTCLNDYTGYITTDAILDHKFDRARLSSDKKDVVLQKLTVDSSECPKPCSHKKFIFDVTHELPDAHNKKYCTDALSALLTPTSHRNIVKWGTTPFIRDSARMLYGDKLDPPNAANWYPCSVVEFEQTEAHGMTFEEYLLYTPSDLASNFGGTMGLWIGASVISIIQAVYIYCLERLFMRLRWSNRATDNDPPMFAQ